MNMIQEGHNLSVRQQCELLGLHRSNLYYCPKINYEDEILRDAIRAIHAKYPFYGRRKIHWYLAVKEGRKINCKKVRRLMKEAGVEALVPKPRLSIPNKENVVFPYLLKDLKITRSNQVWAVDITYIKINGKFGYLVSIIDWHSRFIVGHKLCNTMEASHSVEVLIKAITKYEVPEICNADQGSQFTGKPWIKELQAHGVLVSHDGAGRFRDNIFIERYWRSIKYEDVFIRSYDDFMEAKKSIDEYVQFYNYERPHQSLKYKRPAEVYLDGKKKQCA